MRQPLIPVLQLTEVPESVLPLTPRERRVSYLTHPFLLYAPAVIAFLIFQVFLPSPRLGVNTLWEGSLRLIVGCVAITPSFILGVPTVIRGLRNEEAPNLYAGRMALAAVAGASIALLAAWALGAALTLELAALAWVGTILWIGVTGIVAVFTSLAIRIRLSQERMLRAEEQGIPTSMWVTTSLTSTAV